MRGCVRVEGALAKRPGLLVRPDANITIEDPAANYVSRAALKLIAGLDVSGIDVGGKTCLDLGASTGGFTQVLLQRGAKHIIAIDVGHGQMAAKLASDDRVTNLEGINARDLTEVTLADRKIEIIVSDVSFISLKLALPPALKLAQAGAKGIFLVKPQFEAGKDQIGKGGILRNSAMALNVAEDLRDWIDDQPDWHHTHLLPSPVTGGDGNVEFLLVAGKHSDDHRKN